MKKCAPITSLFTCKPAMWCAK